MEGPTINRRKALAGAGAAGLGVIGTLATLRPATAEAAGGGPGSVVGAWDVTVVDHDRDETIRAVIAFSPGGSAVETDDGGATGVGGWSATEARGFQFTLAQFIVDPQDGKLSFTIKGHGRLVDDSVNGTSRVKVVDSQGNVLFQSASPQTFTGKRLQP